MYRQSEKNPLNSNISCTSPHNMVNIGPIAAEICWRLNWCNPANFNRFCVLASLLHRRRSTDVWPSSGLQYTRYIHFRGLLSLTEFCDVQNSLWVKSCVLLYWQGYCTALEHKRRQPNCGVQQRAPPIYGRAAITFGIGPHSRCK